jgi:hypothetical protein
MPAVTISLASASQNFLKYKLISDGIAAANLDAAAAATPDLLTDSKTGSPLKAILGTTVANAAATRAVLERADIEFYLVSCHLTALWLLTPDANAGKIRLTFTAAAADVGGSYFFIGYRHSMIQ